MQVRICDKCKIQFVEFPMQAVRFPVVEVRANPCYANDIYNNGKWNNVDLCPNCQHDVYDFIFKEGKE